MKKFAWLWLSSFAGLLTVLLLGGVVHGQIVIKRMSERELMQRDYQKLHRQILEGRRSYEEKEQAKEKSISIDCVPFTRGWTFSWLNIDLYARNRWQQDIRRCTLVKISPKYAWFVQGGAGKQLKTKEISEVLKQYNDGKRHFTGKDVNSCTVRVELRESLPYDQQVAVWNRVESYIRKKEKDSGMEKGSYRNQIREIWGEDAMEKPKRVTGK